MRIVLYQPDIPQNTGTLIRLSACLGLGLDIVEPCGFPMSDKDLRRAAMDYAASADVVRHRSWAHYIESTPAQARLILLSTQGTTPYTGFAFQPEDRLVLGRESAGAAEEVWQTVDAGIAIPMQSGMRSLNVALAAAMVAGEALRQFDGFAKLPPSR